MAQMTSKNTISTLTHVYTKASTSPAKGLTQDGSECVVKFYGAGPGPVGLLTEFVALRAACAMSLRVPETWPVYLPENFPWMLGTDEFDGIVQRSSGWNLGVAFIPNAEPASPQAVLEGHDYVFLERLAQVDRVLANTDRSFNNTNILRSADGLIAIDFDACLFLRRVARGLVPDTFSLWDDHLLLSRNLMLPALTLPVETLTHALEEAPCEWIEATGLNRQALIAGLAEYAAAWNASIST